MAKAVRITFRSEIFIEGEDMKDVKKKFEALPFYDVDFVDGKNVYDYGFCEIVSIEDANNGYEDLMAEYSEV